MITLIFSFWSPYRMRFNSMQGVGIPSPSSCTSTQWNWTCSASFSKAHSFPSAASLSIGKTFPDPSFCSLPLCYLSFSHLFIYLFSFFCCPFLLLSALSSSSLSSNLSFLQGISPLIFFHSLLLFPGLLLLELSSPISFHELLTIFWFHWNTVAQTPECIYKL